MPQHPWSESQSDSQSDSQSESHPEPQSEPQADAQADAPADRQTPGEMRNPIGGNANLDCLEATRKWVESVVVELGLCPFARRVLTGGRMKLLALECQTTEALLEAIAARCLALQQNTEPETLLLVIPAGLDEFEQFLDVVALAEQLLESLSLTGVLQLAHFHPRYRFADEPEHAASHFTNRSPYPVLHVLREAQVSAVLEHYPDPEQIPLRNIEQLEALGEAEMRRRLAACQSVD